MRGPPSSALAFAALSAQSARLYAAALAATATTLAAAALTATTLAAAALTLAAAALAAAALGPSPPPSSPPLPSPPPPSPGAGTHLVVYAPPQHPQLAYYSHTDHSHAVAAMLGTQGRLRILYATIVLLLCHF